MADWGRGRRAAGLGCGAWAGGGVMAGEASSGGGGCCWRAMAGADEGAFWSRAIAVSRSGGFCAGLGVAGLGSSSGRPAVVTVA